jgi:hypothetical protein
MLEWLSKILEKIEGADALQEDIEKGIGKSFVARSDFNTKSEELKALATKVEGLEKTIKDSGDAAQKLSELQAKYDTDTAALKAESAKVKLSFLVDAELAKAGARNAKAVKGLLDLEAVKLADDGSVEGLKDQLEAIKANKDTSFLFTTSTPPRTGTPPATGDPKPEPKPDSLGASIAKEISAQGGQSNSTLAKLFGKGE